MAALSRLHGRLGRLPDRLDARTSPRQVGGAGMRLADARALRTALAAKARRGDDDRGDRQPQGPDPVTPRRRSRSDSRRTLRSLHRQVDFSSISVTINAAMVPGHPVSKRRRLHARQGRPRRRPGARGRGRRGPDHARRAGAARDGGRARAVGRVRDPPPPARAGARPRLTRHPRSRRRATPTGAVIVRTPARPAGGRRV